MLLLGWAFLSESIGPHRIGASVVGFIGTLLVIQPSFANVGWPAMLPLFVAVVFALFVVVTRILAKSSDPIALQATSGLFALPMIVPLFAVGAVFETPMLGIETPSIADAYLLFIVGVLGTVGHLLMTWSLRFAPSATLAPMQYLEIPFATLFGWLMFKDLPNGMAAVGIGITIAAGLYIIMREQATARGNSKARA